MKALISRNILAINGAEYLKVTVLGFYKWTSQLIFPNRSLQLNPVSPIVFPPQFHSFLAHQVMLSGSLSLNQREMTNRVPL